MDISNQITGASGILKNGTNTVTFFGSAANTYVGATLVNQGTLVLSKTNAVAVAGELIVGDGTGGHDADVVKILRAEQIADSSAVTVNGSGLLNCSLLPLGESETVGSLTLDSGGHVMGPNSSTLTVSGALVCGVNPSVSTSVIEGSGTRGLILLNSSSRLQGSGTVGDLAPDSSQCVVAPGDSPGILTCSNLINGSGTLQLELNGTTPGSGYDQLIVRGSVVLSNIALSASLNFASSLSNQFTIIRNDGPNAVGGTFTGLPQNSTLTVGGEQFRISYTGGEGNSVVLTQITGASRPRLSIQQLSPANVLLSWPTNNAAGFGLQSNTNLSTTNWASVSPPPSIIGTNNVVTNTLTGNRFYRLFK